jgi:hypothetical protein
MWWTQSLVTLGAICLAVLVPVLTPVVAAAYLPMLMWGCAQLRASMKASVFANLLEEGCWEEVRQTRLTTTEMVDSFVRNAVESQLRDALWLCWIPSIAMAILVWLALAPGLSDWQIWLAEHCIGSSWPRTLLGMVITVPVWLLGLGLQTGMASLGQMHARIDDRRPAAAVPTSAAPWVLAVLALVLAMVNYSITLALATWAVVSAPLTLPLALYWANARSRRRLIARLEEAEWMVPVVRVISVEPSSRPEVRPLVRVRLRPWSDNPLVLKDCLQESICPDGSRANWYIRHAGFSVLLMALTPLLTFYAVVSQNRAVDLRGVWGGLFCFAALGLGGLAQSQLGKKLAREHFGRTLEALRATPLSSRDFVDGWAQIAFVPALVRLAPMLGMCLVSALFCSALWDSAAFLLGETMMLGVLLMLIPYSYLLYLIGPSMGQLEAERAKASHGWAFICLLLGPALITYSYRYAALVFLFSLLLLLTSRRTCIEWDSRGPQV